MSDVKNTKAKKMDVRVSDAIYEEVEMVAWVSEKKRSELLRIMIADFMSQGSLEIGGQKKTWDECVAYAKAKMFEQDVSLDDLQRSRGNKQALSESLNKELESFADEYAHKALQAFKKHSGA